MGLTTRRRRPAPRPGRLSVVRPGRRSATVGFRRRNQRAARRPAPFCSTCLRAGKTRVWTSAPKQPYAFLERDHASLAPPIRELTVPASPRRHPARNYFGFGPDVNFRLPIGAALSLNEVIHIHVIEARHCDLTATATLPRRDRAAGHRNRKPFGRPSVLPNASPDRATNPIPWAKPRRATGFRSRSTPRSSAR